MERIPGYDESPIFTGGSNALPAGKYICVIKGANDVTASSGRKQLVILFDIAEGEYKGFYDAKYKSDCLSYGQNAKWGGVFRQGYEGRQLPFFKGLTTSIEESNPGYKWDWNEKGLKGKKIGLVFGREQFKASDGTVKWATKAVKARSIQKLGEEKIPEDKLLPGVRTTAAAGPMTQGFVDLGNADEDDLPF